MVEHACDPNTAGPDAGQGALKASLDYTVMIWVGWHTKKQMTCIEPWKLRNRYFNCSTPGMMYSRDLSIRPLWSKSTSIKGHV